MFVKSYVLVSVCAGVFNCVCVYMFTVCVCFVCVLKCVCARTVCLFQCVCVWVDVCVYLFSTGIVLRVCVYVACGCV